MTLNELLVTRYRRFARGPEEYDCWGMARAAWNGLFGKCWLPEEAGVCPTDKRSLTKSTHDVVRKVGLSVVEIRPGALATAWRGRLCVHVGIVVDTQDDRRWILETDEGIGPSLTEVDSFAARYEKVAFYDQD